MAILPKDNSYSPGFDLQSMAWIATGTFSGVLCGSTHNLKTWSFDHARKSESGVPAIIFTVSMVMLNIQTASMGAVRAHSLISTSRS